MDNISSLKISIIIPTRNRQKYCEAAVRQILTLKLPNVEVVVQDNSDLPILMEVLGTEEMKLAGVIYNYTPGEISFVDNFSNAIENSTGQWLCMIGDDDGILPSIQMAVEMAERHNIDAVLPVLVNYIWPDNNDYNDKEAGEVTIYRRKFFEPCEVDIAKSLDSLVNNAMLGYNSSGIPRLYHGLVKRACVTKIKQIKGKYFDGLSPDIYNAVALCFTCQKVVRIDYPITISGVCHRSGTSDQKSGRHTGYLKDAPHFRGHTNYIWEPEIPYLYSVMTIWAETGLKALKHFSPERAESFPIKKLVERIYTEEKRFRHNCREFLKINHISDKGLTIAWLKGKNLTRMHSVLSHLLKILVKKRRDIKFHNVKNIEQAVNTVSEFWGFNK